AMGFNAYKGGGKMIVTYASVSAYMSADGSGMSAGSGYSVGSGHEMSKVYNSTDALVFVTAFSVAFGTGNSTGGNSQFAN
ncbi:flagellin, partial [Campylobacter lari]|nr:flagellin [Campylobacter lari]